MPSAGPGPFSFLFFSPFLLFFSFGPSLREGHFYFILCRQLIPLTMASLSQDALEASEPVLYVVFDLVAQTFVFGVYTLLFCLSTRMLLKRKFKTQVVKIMLFITLFMYLLSSAYWTYTIVYAADMLRQHIDVPPEPLPDHDRICEWYPMLNAFIMINFVLSDCVVVWRAWVIAQRRLRKYLWVTMGLVALTAIAVALTIAFRIVAFIQSPINNLGQKNLSYIESALNILQFSTAMLSLLSNFSATAVVGLTARRHHRLLRSAFTKEEATSQSGTILGLVAEVGAFYCLSTLILLVGSLVRLPHGTLRDLYIPINVHIVGTYPPTVILLVNMNRSSNDSETVFSDTLSPRSPLRRLEFTSVDVSPTTTIGAPGIMPPLKKALGTSDSKPKPASRFSDATFDPTYDIQ
ncbi:hypothetical protein K438DRAFT_668354 [Mycena galopus ATCC 62051]|nr:hypothetical protein K438DRAFT_668354 [Mycena galopus ATCC 62051]